MKLVHLRVQNYRNLQDVSVSLDPSINYLIGENNIGKSNFLHVFDSLLSGAPIEDGDYLDPTRPLRVEIELRLMPGETFGNAEGEVVRIALIKDIADRIVCKDMATGAPLDTRLLRRINYFQANAAKAMAGSDAGISAFLLHIIRRQARSRDGQIDDVRLTDLVQSLNEQLGRLKLFSDLGLHADIARNTAGSLSSLIHLMDESSRPVEHSGLGARHSAMAMMNVLSRILRLYNSRSLPLSGMTYETAEGKRILPMVFAVDEPEAHLHPYMQRSLIRYYKRIMASEDAPFLELLKTCFDLDGLDGQLLIITHSTDALVDNFRSLVRFYKDADGLTKAACGPLMRISPDIEKHLIMQFPDIKEAFYARCALLVEGVTESCSLRLFSQTLGAPTDDLGICVIDSGGEGALRKLHSLLGRFGIPCVLMFDGDVRRGNEERPDEFYTQTDCFETEIVQALIDAGAYDILEGIPAQLEEDAMTRALSRASLSKALQKFHAQGLRLPRNLAALRRDNEAQYRLVYASWFYHNKGAILGRVIGKSLPEHCIPRSYREAILRARALALGSRGAGRGCRKT